MKYFTKITGWGEDALGFLEEEDMNFLVILTIPRRTSWQRFLCCTNRRS